MRVGVAFLAASLFFAATAAGQEPSPEFRYSTDAEAIIIEFEQRSGYMHWGEPHFGLKLFGDGRVVAFLPDHFPKAILERRGFSIARRGAFETRLTPQEVEAILCDVEPAFMINTEEMKRERRQEHPGRSRTDGGITTLSINLTNYRPANGSWRGAVAQAIKWKDVYGDAQLYPGVGGIQALSQATQALPAWVYRLAARVDAE